MCRLVIALVVAAAAAKARADKPEGLSPQTIKLPTGATSLKGLGESFSVSAATGTGSVAVPIELPPGFLQPQLSLAYSGGRGATALGMGFDLPILRIYRTTDKGSPVFTEQDRFAVSGPSLNDELVAVEPGGNLYRLKNEGSFALFIRDARNDTWTIRLPDGHTAYLGEGADERETSLGRAYAWFQTRHVDAYGHTLRHAYVRDQGKLYLSSISYQLEAAPGAQNRVTFEYEARSDVRTNYTYGDAITLGLRLARVQVFHGQRRLRSYELGYREALLFSLLESVRMTGESGEVMPPVTFSYLEPSADSGIFVQMRALPPLDGLLTGNAVLEDVTQDGLPDLLVTKAGSYVYYENVDGLRWSSTPISVARCSDVTLLSSGAVLTDVDGDAQRDLAYLQADGKPRYCPSRGVTAGKFLGFGAVRSLAISEPNVHFASPQAKMVDLNSDGRIDLLYPKPGTDLALLNLDDRFISQNVRELPADADFGSPATMLSDFNGDGVLDLLRNELGSAHSRLRVFFGLGAGQYASERIVQAPQGDPGEFHLVDVNRDGQTDLVRVSGSWVSYYFKDSSFGFTAAQANIYGMPASAKTRKLLWADMNGNGTADVIWLTTDGKLYYLDLMSEPHAGLLSRIDNGLGMVTELSYRSSSEFAIDAKLAGAPWTTTLPFPHAVIETMTVSDSFDSLGGKLNSARTSYEYHDGFYDGREREFRGFGRVITREWGDEAQATLETEQRFHVGRNLDTGADEEMLKSKLYLSVQRDENGNVLHSAEVSWQLHWACREDLPGKEAVLPACAGVSDRMVHKDELVALPLAVDSLEGHWEGTSQPRWVASSSHYDAWGGVFRTEQHGEVALSATHELGEPFDLTTANLALGSDELSLEVDRAYDIADWQIGIPYEQRLFSARGDLVSSTRRFFDGDARRGLPLGEIDRGSVSRESAWLETTHWVDTTRSEYNADGLASVMLDANDNRRELVYDDAAHMFPVRERMFVENDVLEFQASYDPARGSLTMSRDANDHATYYRYDGLGRITSLIDAEDPAAPPLTHYEYSFGNTAHPISTTVVHTRLSEEPQRYRTSFIYSDGLGRTRLTKVEAEAPFGYLASDFQDLTSRGAVARVFDAFPSAISDFELPPAATLTTLKQYDALGRVTDAHSPATAQLPSLATHHQYLPLEVRSYGERDVSEQTLRYPGITRVDGLGRIRQSERIIDDQGQVRSLLWTSSYNALGKITEIVDPTGNAAAVGSAERALHTRSYAYDSRGHLITLDDPNLGSIAFAYDLVGNMVHSVDALGQEQSFHFGAANRLLERIIHGDAAGRPDYSYRYHYDARDPDGPLGEATNLRGRLAWVDYPVGSEHYGYDREGRRTLEAQSLWDPARSDFTEQERDLFIKRRTFADDGSLARLDLPGAVFMQPTYNARRLAVRLDVGFAGDVRSVVSDAAYDQHGAPLRVDYGNGLRSCKNYDARGQLLAVALARSSELDCSQFAGAQQTGIQHIEYARSFEGNIAGVSDLSVPRPGVLRMDASYEYDRLNQLVHAVDVHGDAHFSYDALQNMTRRTNTASSAVDAVSEFHYGERGAGFNALTSLGARTLDYDALGRLANHRGYALGYDAEGRLTSAHKDARTIEFFYGPGGERKLSIVRNAGKPSSVHRFVFDEYEQRDGESTWSFDAASAKVELSSVQGVLIDATLLDALTAYLHGDHSVKPLPQELLDLDGNGTAFDERDLAAATEAFWNERRVGTSSMVFRYQHPDQLGSPTHETDSVGDLIAQQAFEVYGTRRAVRGQAPSHGFAGARNEDEADLGLLRFGARYYAPELAHWITPDLHIGESADATWSSLRDANLYAYAGNNPVAYRDPTGTQTAQGGGSEENMTPAEIASMPSEPAGDGPMCEAHSCPGVVDVQEFSGDGMQINVHQLYTDKTKSTPAGTTTVYNGNYLVYAQGKAATDLDGWRLADRYDRASARNGYVHGVCEGGPCKIESGLGAEGPEKLYVVAGAVARNPHLDEDNPDRYISAVDYNYTTIPKHSQDKGGAFVGLHKGDAAIIRYKDHIVFGLIGDIGNSYEFGENSLRTQVLLGFDPAQYGPTAKQPRPHWHFIGHDTRDVEYIYLKNTAHLLRDKHGVLLPQAQIDTIVKGLYQKLLGPIGQ